MRQHTLYKYSIRLVAVLLAFLLLVGMAPAAHAASDSGSCGKNLKWSLEGDTLTITGSGDMTDFPESTMAPWYAYRREIAKVQLPEGLTSIGDLAFYECSALEFVTVPDSVKEIGWHAFSGCTSMTMLDLSSGLKTIGAGAFRGCTALPALRLHNGLTSIGDQAFYRCEALTEITIPSSVKALGHSAFSFCYKLVRADIQAPLKTLPSWTFYGCGRLTLPSTLESVDEFAFYDCDDLTDVVYNGSEENKEEILDDIRRDQEGRPEEPNIVEQPGEEPSSSDDFTEDESGNLSGDITTTEQTENASVSSTISVIYSNNTLDSIIAHVDVTLETASAWSEISEAVADVVRTADETTIDVYIKDSTALASDALKDLWGKKVVMTIHNASGSVWKIDFYQNETSTEEESDGGLIGRLVKKDKDTQTGYDLSYERLDATAEQLELLGCTVGYQIRFLSDAQVNAEVMIKLPLENARKNASLYQIKRGDKELVQTVLVDDAGYAHFYLASVDQETEYLIGIDVQNVEQEAVIIPEVLHQDYGVTEQLSNMEYVVTGRTSSWGMTINQVTLYLVGGMLSAVIIIGVVMFMLNKRKLKMGYIPDIDDDEEA